MDSCPHWSVCRSNVNFCWWVCSASSVAFTFRIRRRFSTCMVWLSGINNYSQHLCYSTSCDGIAQKIATGSWYAIPPSSTAGSEEEKAIAFRVAEGIRWTEIGINSYFRILQGAVAIIFGVAIAKSAFLSRWIGAVGITVGAVGIAAGVVTAYIGFSEPVSNIWAVTLYLWIIILGIFMWRKTRAKKMISR